jgi:hypothetical protein
MVQSQAEKKTSENNHDNPLFPAERLARFLPSKRFNSSLKIKSLNNLLLYKAGMNRNGIVAIKNHRSIYPDKWYAIRRAKNDIIAKEFVNRLYE